MLGGFWCWFLLWPCSLMEGSLLLETVDSLWFFSNVLSSTSQPIVSLSRERVTDEEDPPKPIKPTVHRNQNESPKAELLSPRKHINAIVHTQPNESLKIESLSPKCPKCGEFSTKTEPQSLPVEGIILQEAEFKKHAKKDVRSSSRRRRRKSKRKILGELDLVFDNGTYMLKDYDAANACGFGKIGSQQHLVKMPSLSDDMAMKEHLKSWAYAVACTVK